MTNIEEIWKDIPNFPSYQVSNLARIRTVGRWVKNTISTKRFVQAKILTQTNNGKGYLIVGPQINRIRKNIYVHRTVAEAFIKNPNNLPEVNHEDGNKANNLPSNLKWVTLQQNRDHAVANDLMVHGEKNYNAKLTSTQVDEIRSYFKKNPEANQTQIGQKYGVDGEDHLTNLDNEKEN